MSSTTSLPVQKKVPAPLENGKLHSFSVTLNVANTYASPFISAIVPSSLSTVIPLQSQTDSHEVKTSPILSPFYVLWFFPSHPNQSHLCRRK